MEGAATQVSQVVNVVHSREEWDRTQAKRLDIVHHFRQPRSRDATSDFTDKET